MNLPAFVISLERATVRRAHMERLASLTTIPFTFIPAVDGRPLSPAETSRHFRANAIRPHYPFKILPGEIGCFLSHRSVWQRMVDENIDRALVLEDDITFDPAAFEAAANFLARAARDEDYVQFLVRPHRGPVFLRETGPGFDFVCPVLPSLRTSAQFVTLGAARKLLQATEIFDRPVDSVLQMGWLTGITPTHIWPSPVRTVEAELGGSTIAVRPRSKAEKIRREIIRFIYRVQIKYKARRHAATIAPDFLSGRKP